MPTGRPKLVHKMGAHGSDMIGSADRLGTLTIGFLAGIGGADGTNFRPYPTSKCLHLRTEFRTTVTLEVGTLPGDPLVNILGALCRADARIVAMSSAQRSPQRLRLGGGRASCRAPRLGTSACSSAAEPVRRRRRAEAR